MPGGVNDISGAKKLVEQMKAKNSDQGEKISDKEKAKLAEALANTQDAEAKAYLQDQIINISSTRNNGNVVGNQGPVYDSGNNNGNIKSGNVTNSNNVVINNPTPPDTQPIPDPDPPKKQIDAGDVESGKKLAERLHEQTDASGGWGYAIGIVPGIIAGSANNTKVNGVFAEVDNKNAYSFFKEYKALAQSDSNKGTTGAMHDAHDLTEIFVAVENKNTFPAVRALVDQARAAGVPQAQLTPLESLLDQYPRSGDISADTGARFDRAISNLLSVMSRYVTE